MIDAWFLTVMLTIALGCVACYSIGWWARGCYEEDKARKTKVTK